MILDQSYMHIYHTILVDSLVRSFTFLVDMNIL